FSPSTTDRRPTLDDAPLGGKPLGVIRIIRGNQLDVPVVEGLLHRLVRRADLVSRRSSLGAAEEEEGEGDDKAKCAAAYSHIRQRVVPMLPVELRAPVRQVRGGTDVPASPPI